MPLTKMGQLNEVLLGERMEFCFRRAKFEMHV